MCVYYTGSQYNKNVLYLNILALSKKFSSYHFSPLFILFLFLFYYLCLLRLFSAIIGLLFFFFFFPPKAFQKRFSLTEEWSLLLKFRTFWEVIKYQFERLTPSAHSRKPCPMCFPAWSHEHVLEGWDLQLIFLLTGLRFGYLKLSENHHLQLNAGKYNHETSMHAVWHDWNPIYFHQGPFSSPRFSVRTLCTSNTSTTNTWNPYDKLNHRVVLSFKKIIS